MIESVIARFRRPAIPFASAITKASPAFLGFRGKTVCGRIRRSAWIAARGRSRPELGLIESTERSSATKKNLALLQVRDFLYRNVQLGEDLFVVCWTAMTYAASRSSAIVTSNAAWAALTTAAYSVAPSKIAATGP